MSRLLVLLGLLMATSADAADVILTEDDPIEMKDRRGYKNLVVPGMMFFPFGFKGRYQRLLGDQLSVMIGGGIAEAMWRSADLDIGWGRWHWMAGADLHPFGNGLHGLYLGPRIKYQHGIAVWNWELFEQRYGLHHDLMVVRGIIGWRWVTRAGFSAAVGIGGGYRHMVREYHVDDAGGASDLRMTTPALEANLGWAF